MVDRKFQAFLGHITLKGADAMAKGILSGIFFYMHVHGIWWMPLFVYVTTCLSDFPLILGWKNSVSFKMAVFLGALNGWIATEASVSLFFSGELCSDGHCLLSVEEKEGLGFCWWFIFWRQTLPNVWNRWKYCLVHIVILSSSVSW